MSVTDRPICRRCKKKRALDEPLETARYRTCKPCREIERKKKRLKKLEQLNKNRDDPSAAAAAAVSSATAAAAAAVATAGISSSIDTSKQSQYQVEQNIINLANQVTRSNQLPPHIQQYQQTPPVLAPIQQQQQNIPKIQKVEEKDIPIDELLLKQGSVDDQHDPNVVNNHSQNSSDSDVNARLPSAGYQQGQQQQNQQQQQQFESGQLDLSEAETKAFQAINNVQNLENLEDSTEADLQQQQQQFHDDTFCSYCGSIRSINDNGRYQLCGDCVENPLITSSENVFNNFDEFLKKIESGKFEDLKNIVFIKKSNDDELIESFDSINSDSIIEELNTNYIGPIIQVSGFKFSKSSSSLSTKPYPKSIKLLYKCKQDVKTIQKTTNNHNNVTSSINQNNRKLKTEDCQSNLYLSYDIISKNLSIKFNHKTHKPVLEKFYSTNLINKVKELTTRSNDLSEIYNFLKEINDEALVNEVNQLKKFNFMKDFSNF